ncbi:unnamed protein product [Chilo suppressalis]|uniref:WD repeat-containing protein 55 homolog n=1 Tax=Chilo suppressalis TaxID=168631 RepID=A0ABN8AXE4_CHISP|nr:hypothetical protein evm_007659 [Chilo suppressalis]CAH0398773.1 unnamed protein product [Chilo suppressalis]
MATKVHKVRYYNPKPDSINCVSYNKTSKQIALARADASIEIWDLCFAPYLVKFIPGVENSSIEALGWVCDRLLSTGLGGALVEWDLQKLNKKTTVLLTGHAAWCLDVNSSNTLVAVGTEQGYINLYSVEHDEITYRKLFDKQEGRIMCCKFDKAGNVLVTGSINTIRVWNVETGHVTCRMLASRRGKETIVWSLAVLSDNLVVSGDSLGRLTFWDGILGEQIESYTTHKADILSIVVTDDEKSLYCSGVDPVIVNFIKVNNNNNKQSCLQWVKNVQRHIHEHDVRCLVLNGDRLVSVGADGYLTLSSYPPKWVMRVPPMIPAPRSSISARKKMILLRYKNHLEVWKLGSYATNESGKVVFSNPSNFSNSMVKDSNEQIEQDTAIAILEKANKKQSKSQSLTIVDKPVKLVLVKTKDDKQIRCCGLSPNGEFIIYSTDSAIRMLKLETDEDKSNTTLSKMPVSGAPASCDRVAFTADSSLALITCEDRLLVLQLDPQVGAIAQNHTIPIYKYLKSNTILHLQVSDSTSSGTVYLVVVDTQGAIAVWTKGNRKFEHYVTLPTYKCTPSALTVDCAHESLVVVYVDQKITEYDLVKKKFLEWPNNALAQEWAERRSAVSSVCAHPTRDALVFSDDTSLWVMERRQGQPEEPVAKKKVKGGTNFGLKVIPIKYLVGFHWLDKDEAVILEIPPENIVMQLPAVLNMK